MSVRVYLSHTRHICCLVQKYLFLLLFYIYIYSIHFIYIISHTYLNMNIHIYIYVYTCMYPNTHLSPLVHPMCSVHRTTVEVAWSRHDAQTATLPCRWDSCHGFPVNDPLAAFGKSRREIAGFQTINMSTTSYFYPSQNIMTMVFVIFM